jgi:hypothetical protein
MLITACLVLVCGVLVVPWVFANQNAETHLVWSRGAGGVIEVTGNSHGTRLPEGHDELQRIAERLDALRTTEPHVRWQKMVWVDGRIAVDAHAVSATYANLTMLAVRDLWPDRRSAGSGMRQLRGAKGPMKWHVQVRLTPPPPG